MKFRKPTAMRGVLFGTTLGLIATTLFILAPQAASPAKAATFCGGASWYAMTSRTASGERANPNTMTAAHRTLPFGTKVVVENMRNRRKVTVRINDRGPFVRGRIIDLSKAAAQKIGMVRSGTARVRVTTSSRSARKVRLSGAC